MKNLLFAAALMVLALVACQPQAPSAETETETEKSETAIDNTEIEVLKVNTDSIATAQMAKRQALENDRGELMRKELKTDNLRAQVSQKWALLHFYFKDEQLVRVKTYPHGTVSARTEEFYFENENLIAAVIEDNGLAETGEKQVEDDKAYYFFEGELVKEINNSKEGETSIKESDAERLLQEAKEYQEIATKL
jgi:hypothetical protein